MHLPLHLRLFDTLSIDWKTGYSLTAPEKKLNNIFQLKREYHNHDFLPLCFNTEIGQWLKYMSTQKLKKSIYAAYQFLDLGMHTFFQVFFSPVILPLTHSLS